MALQVVQHLKG